MAHDTWFLDLLKELLDRLFRHKHHHKHHPPSAIHNLKVKLHMSTATLTWTIPTTRTDGSPLSASDIQTFMIFDNGVEIGETGSVVASPQPTTASFTTEDLLVGTHNFTVTTTDTAGHTSSVSNTATLVVEPTLANPSAVTDLMAVLNA